MAVSVFEGPSLPRGNQLYIYWPLFRRSRNVERGSITSYTMPVTLDPTALIPFGNGKEI